MKRKESIKWLKTFRGRYGMNELEDAVDVAIKALEQESALDKVRAEIAAYGSIWVEYNISGHTDHDIEVIVENVLKQAKEQVLDVIDKYKAESEVHDADSN